MERNGNEEAFEMDAENSCYDDGKYGDCWQWRERVKSRRPGDPYGNCSGESENEYEYEI